MGAISSQLKEAVREISFSLDIVCSSILLAEGLQR